MFDNDEELRELQGNEARKTMLEGRLARLTEQRQRLLDREAELGAARMSEELDVEELEGNSLANFFYRVIGKLDDKLTKERAEAYEAAVRHDAVMQELEAMDYDIGKLRTELKEIEKGAARYRELLQFKQMALQASDSAESREAWNLQGRLTYLESQIKELKEAIDAGISAELMTEDVMKSLRDAEGWGVYDVIGGGMIADLAKHSCLDKAQANSQRLQVQLNRFRNELADVKIHHSMSVAVDGFERFADYFFDGLIADWSVLSRIKNSIKEVERTRQDIRDAVQRLRELQGQTEQEHREMKAKLEKLILQAKV